MLDMVASIFRLENERGFFSPKIDIKYLEKDSDIQWIINCGGTRAYFFRIGSDLLKNADEQAADSHFMANRVITTLFLSGCGLFCAKAMGRFIIEDINSDEIKFHTSLDVAYNKEDEQNEKQILDEFSDWYTFICENTLFRRAADDAYNALANPVEADFFIYRGMEWLLKAANIKLSDLASDMGVSLNDLKKYKHQVNVELGQRHGIQRGIKRRAIAEDYGSLLADFMNAFAKARKRVDPDFSGIIPERIVEIVMKAMPFMPYP